MINNVFSTFLRKKSEPQGVDRRAYFSLFQNALLTKKGAPIQCALLTSKSQ